MTLEEFRSLVDTWGADVERWPHAARASARQLAATPQAVQMLVAARALDALLAAGPEVSRARVQRAAHAVALRVAAESGRKVERRRRWDLSSWLVPAVSVACSAIVGISLAMTLPLGDQDREPIVLGMILDSGSLAAGWTLQ